MADRKNGKGLVTLSTLSAYKKHLFTSKWVLVQYTSKVSKKDNIILA